MQIELEVLFCVCVCVCVIRFNNFRYSMIADLFPAEEDKRSIDMAQDAVVVRYAHKRYSKSQAPILDGLNMTVPRGSM
jgi:hypothetical protein